MKNNNFIRIENLDFAYSQENQIFKKCNLHIPSDKITLITGKNGAGKTTLCRLLSGLEKNFSGKIELAGKSIKELSIEKISAKLIHLKQNAIENIISTNPDEDLSIWQHKFMRKDNKNALKQREKALCKVNLQENMKTPVWEMSSGQIKRIGLSTLLLFENKFWILDEPSAGLDDNFIEILLNILHRRKQNHRGTLVVTHRRKQFEKICDMHLSISEKKFI